MNHLEPGWKNQLEPEFAKPYMANLREFLKSAYLAKKIIYPAKADYFAAFQSTPFDRVKVVILGQDPYHGPGQAHGLSFSVRPGVAPPPSLVNIFEELKRDLGVRPPRHGYLQSWAEEGVLLLNSTLTVEAGKPGSHRGQGWETFTDQAINRLSQARENLVFLLWGSFAQKKAELIDNKKHLILTAPHPSPLSAYRGFFGCKHFSIANDYLKTRGIAPIHWSISLHNTLPKENVL